MIERLGGQVAYEGEVVPPSVSGISPKPSLSWLQALMGDENFDEICFISFDSHGFTDTQVEHVKLFRKLSILFLDNTQVSDAGLVHLEGLSNLGWLSLKSTQVTDAGLEHLRGLRELQMFILDDTNVTPEGVKRLQEALPNCKIEY